jgi:hypothetical protein
LPNRRMNRVINYDAGGIRTDRGWRSEGETR